MLDCRSMNISKHEHVYAAPIAVELEITARCNRSCIHCRLEEQSLHEMDIKDIKAVIDQLAEAKVLSLIITGGEPLLRKDVLLETITYAHERGIPNIFLVTNATLLTYNFIRQLDQISSFRALHFSLDGATSETNDKIRGEGSFNAVIEALKMCSKVHFQKGVETVVLKGNSHEIPHILRLALDFGANIYGIGRLFPIGRGRKCHGMLGTAPQEHREVIRSFNELKKVYANRILMISEDPLNVLFDDHTRIRCTAGLNYCAITAQGDVRPCITLPVNVGNLLKTPLKVIWNHAETFKKLRNKKNLKGRCGACAYNQTCGGCRAYAFCLTGDFLAEDPLCWLNQRG